MTLSSASTRSVPVSTRCSGTPARRMPEDMDIDAGKILTGGATVADVGREIFEKMLAVASGEKTKSELAGVGEEEFAPWSIGPTL